MYTPAWQQAAQNSNRDTTNNTNSRDEKTEIELITNAIVTALSDDAGGYGTAGFHVVRFSSSSFLYVVFDCVCI